MLAAVERALLAPGDDLAAGAVVLAVVASLDCVLHACRDERGRRVQGRDRRPRGAGRILSEGLVFAEFGTTHQRGRSSARAMGNNHLPAEHLPR